MAFAIEPFFIHKQSKMCKEGSACACHARRQETGDGRWEFDLLIILFLLATKEVP